MDYKLCEGIQMSQTLKKYLIALTMISAMAISSPTYAFCFFNCDGDNSEQIEENAERIEQVNKEDMRVKNGTASGDNLSLRVEDEAKTQGRDEIYGEDVNIDVSSLNQSEEVVSNKSDIDANAARIEQVNKEDMRVKSGELNDGTLTLRVEDMEKTQGRDEIYGKDVDIDLSDLDQSEEVSENRTDIDTNTTNISNNRTDIDQNTDRSVANENRSVDNSQRISNNRDDIDSVQQQADVNSLVGGAALLNSVRNSGNIADNEDRLDQNDVTNQQQNNAIDQNTTRSVNNQQANTRQDGEIDDVQRQANGNSLGVIVNSLRISGNDRDIAEHEDRLDQNDVKNQEQDQVLNEHDSRINDNADGVAKNKKMNKRQNNVIRDNVARHNQNDVKNDQQDDAIDQNRDRSVANENMNNAQNKVLRDHNGRIETNTTAISDVHNYAVDNRKAIVDTNARIDGVMNDMKYLDRNLSAGVASAMAIGQHQFDPSYSGGQVSLSGGFYNGENAVSFAVGVPVGERAFFSAAIAADSGSNGESGSVGMTFKLP